MELATIILAGGVGKRFKSDRPKILHAVNGQPLVWYPLRLSQSLGSTHTVVVVSPEAAAPITSLIAGEGFHATTVVQRVPNGTAGAVRVAGRALRNLRGRCLILYGDVPLLHLSTLERMVAEVEARQALGGVLTVELPDPTHYGRVVRDGADRIQAIVEERDADASTRAIHEVNTGVLCCEAPWLFSALRQIHSHNHQQEFYLTDIAAVAAREGNPFLPIRTTDVTQCMGVNSRAELAAAEAVLRQRLVAQWMEAGVTFCDPTSVTLDTVVQIGHDTVIESGVTLRGKTTIGGGCHIGQGCIIADSRLGRHVTVKPYSVIEEAQIGDRAQIGPFARLRPGARLDREVRVGNFVEVKNSWLKRGAKANHLTYLGDATIGVETNVGCGTITCNYDGRAKHPTVIGDHVFIGSDTQFVAPVRVGRGAVTAAGSVITEDVPARALAIARGRQVIKRQWTTKRK